MRPTASVFLATSMIWFQMLGFLGFFSSAVVVEKYQMFDKLRLPSSFLFEGGTVEISCSNGGKGEVKLMQLGIPDDKLIANGTGNVFKELNLEPGMIDETFKCYPGLHFKGEYKIKKFLCDPFELVPKIDSCKDEEVCVINKDDTATCEAITDDHCFLQDYVDATRTKYATSLPKLRYVCGDSSDKEVYSYGLCHAKVKKLKEIAGQVADHGDCGFSYKMLLNGRQLEHGGIMAENGKRNGLNLTIEGTVRYDIMKCRLTSSTNETIAESKAPKNQNSLQLLPEPFLDLTLPSKFMLACDGQDGGDTIISTSSYIILYDPSTPTFAPSVQAQVIKPGESISLECRCNAPEGLFCSLSWEKLTDPPEISKTIKKTVLMKEHLQGSVTHNCFSSIYVIGYPASYKMIELAEARKSSPKILKEEDFKKPAGTSANSNSSAPEDANASDTKAKDSDKTSKSSMHPGVIALIVILIIALIIGVLVGLVFWRKSKTQKLSKNEPLTNVQQTRESVDGNVTEDQDPTKRRKSMKAKSAPSTQETGFCHEMLADKDHIFTLAELSRLYEFMGDAIEEGLPLGATEGCVEHLRRMQIPICSKMVKQIDDLRTVTPVGRYLRTCRQPGIAIKVDTFVGDEKQLTDVKGEYLSICKSTAMNMNFATNNDGEVKYILSQSPTKAEMELFLDVVCSKKVMQIVTLQTSSEKDDEDLVIRDCYPYFRMKKDDNENYGNFSLTCTALVQSHSCETRQVTINKHDTKALFTVTIVSFNKFGTGTTINDPKHFVFLHHTLKQFKDSLPKAALTLIHCKDGVGRTGILVATLNCLDFITRFREESINIFRIVEKLRKERIGAIETGNQFCVLYWCIGEYKKKVFMGAAENAIRTKKAAEKSIMGKSMINKSVIKKASVKGKH